MGLNSEYIMGRQECIAQEQSGAQWMENDREVIRVRGAG